MTDETGNDEWSKEGADIVTRLRETARLSDTAWGVDVCLEAADEIERLRDISEQLAAALTEQVRNATSLHPLTDISLAAYQEYLGGQETSL